jgi:hypothetical protein
MSKIIKATVPGGIEQSKSEGRENAIVTGPTVQASAGQSLGQGSSAVTAKAPAGQTESET